MTLFVMIFKFSSEQIYENLSKDSKFSKDSSINVLQGECSSERTFKNFYLVNFGIALGCSFTKYSAATFDTLSLSHTHTHAHTHAQTHTLSLTHTHRQETFGIALHHPQCRCPGHTHKLTHAHTQTLTHTHASLNFSVALHH